MRFTENTKKIMLNLGCGFKTSNSTDFINIDWSPYLRLNRNPIIRFLTKRIVSKERLKNFNSIPKNIMVHNLKNGIPFSDNSVDVVYHSHLFEHLDRHIGKEFLNEINRVLKPGGKLRIVVPDLERLCADYISHINESLKNPSMAKNHDSYIARIIEQSVRRESYATSKQKPIMRFIENLILGDARSRGETHQWMYDRINLQFILQEAGFNNFSVQKFNTSSIANWNSYKLDLNENNEAYKWNSIYVEAAKRNGE